MRKRARETEIVYMRLLVKKKEFRRERERASKSHEQKKAREQESKLFKKLEKSDETNDCFCVSFNRKTRNHDKNNSNT